MQTPLRKLPGLESNPGPSSWEVAALTTRAASRASGTKAPSSGLKKKTKKNCTSQFYPSEGETILPLGASLSRTRAHTHTVCDAATAHLCEC